MIINYLRKNENNWRHKLFPGPLPLDFRGVFYKFVFPLKIQASMNERGIEKCHQNSVIRNGFDGVFLKCC